MCVVAQAKLAETVPMITNFNLIQVQMFRSNKLYKHVFTILIVWTPVDQIPAIFIKVNDGDNNFFK